MRRNRKFGNAPQTKTGGTMAARFGSFVLRSDQLTGLAGACSDAGAAAA
jgi:hypothetical protein